MRKGLLITGIILLLVGLVSIAYPMFVGTSSFVTALPYSSEAVPPIVGSGTFTLHWSGATSTTHLVLFQCLSSNCSQMGPVLANVSGASGTLTATLSAGNSYAIYEYGTPISVPATATMMGITLLVLIGVILLIVGIVVSLLAFAGGRGAPARAPARAAPAMPAEAPEAPAGSDKTYAAEEGPARTIAAAPQLTPGNRANLVCDHCGAINEPWITNCRKCKRALASTSR